MNVTALNASAASRLTVWGSGTRPGGATMAWAAHSLPVSNGVTTGLSSNGKLSFYNAAGTVNLTVDIRGYYLPSSAGPTVYTSYYGGALESEASDTVISSTNVPAGTYLVSGKLYGLASSTAVTHSFLCSIKNGSSSIDFADTTSGPNEYRNLSMQGLTILSAPGTISISCLTNAHASYSLWAISLSALRVTAGN
jgi:hypothetical protein